MRDGKAAHFVLGPAWYDPPSESMGVPGGHHRQRLHSWGCLKLLSFNNSVCATHFWDAEPTAVVLFLLLTFMFLDILISKNPGLRSALFLGTGIIQVDKSKRPSVRFVITP